MEKQHEPPDEVWSAPESGTVRDETSGNQPSPPEERPSFPLEGKDDPADAGAER